MIKFSCSLVIQYWEEDRVVNYLNLSLSFPHPDYKEAACIITIQPFEKIDKCLYK